MADDDDDDEDDNDDVGGDDTDCVDDELLREIEWASLYHALLLQMLADISDPQVCLVTLTRCNARLQVLARGVAMLAFYQCIITSHMSRTEATMWASETHDCRVDAGAVASLVRDRLAPPTGAQGRYYRPSPIDDPDLAVRLRLWIRERAAEKGVPPLTAAVVCRYINTELLSEMAATQPFSESTALVWMHALGFGVRLRGKHIYVDGHEREDVQSASSPSTRKSICRCVRACVIYP
jgi:hypothetical protein